MSHTSQVVVVAPPADQAAQARPEDNFYNVKILLRFDSSYAALKRAVRASAIGAGADVGRK